MKIKKNPSAILRYLSDLLAYILVTTQDALSELRGEANLCGATTYLLSIRSAAFMASRIVAGEPVHEMREELKQVKNYLEKWADCWETSQLQGINYGKQKRTISKQKTRKKP